LGTLERAASVPKVRYLLAPASASLVGDLVRLGLESATGDILLLSYSDDTFAARDVSKFLVYLRDADLVVGTRTTRQMLEQGTNMRGIVRAAHVFLAKLTAVLWWRFDPRFTDICCVYRGLWRSVYSTIRDNLGAHDAAIYPEMVIETLRARRRIIEIPINYYNRDASQSFVRGRYQSAGTFQRILTLIVRKRLSDVAGWRRADTNTEPVHAETPAGEAARFKRLERAWQNEIGYALLDKPYSVPGSAAVFAKQWDRLIAHLDPECRGAVIEIGCGKGHFLEHVRASGRAPQGPLVGIDISRAVDGLPARGLHGVQADGELLPFRDGSAAAVLFDGALHHVIDYPAALREAVRVLAPGGSLVLYEPSSSWFNRLAHRLLDPIVSRAAQQYESPIDIRYKNAFQPRVIVEELQRLGLEMQTGTSDFLAYPFTGCYAGSVFSRSERFMRSLNKLEDWIEATPGLKRLARAFAWRFTIVATKGPGAMALPPAAAARVESPAAVALSSEHSSL
jgi:ubiquinone/menaquinone biosynthesis C-methylase UbiE